MHLMCAICKCDKVDPAARPPFDGWVAVSCQHVFHSYCINKWCQAIKDRALFNEPEFTCPNCRDVWTNPPRVFALRLDYFDDPREVSPSLTTEGKANVEGQKGEEEKEDNIISETKKQAKAMRHSVFQLHQNLRRMERLQLKIDKPQGPVEELVADPLFEGLLRCGLKYAKAGRHSYLKLRQQLGMMERLQLIEAPEAVLENKWNEESGFEHLESGKPPQLSGNGSNASAAADVSEVFWTASSAAAEPEEPPVAKLVEFKGIRLGFKAVRDRQKLEAESSSITNKDEDWD